MKMPFGLRGPRVQLSARLAATSVLAAATALGIGIAVGNLGTGFDEQVRLIRDQIRSRPASGQIHLVEIDARSLSRLGVWPWPRDRHGELVDRLRDMGATTVAFDVDFSAASPNASSDAAFAAALERFGGSVILPTFRQTENGTSSQMLENLPIPALRQHAFLASVNVQTDKDGQLRNYSYGTVTGGQPRPSIGALLAGSASGIDRSFRVDGAIDSATLPRHSFADILDRNEGGQPLKGKSVLVGATAIELGDRYAMSGQGVLPGMVIQALAAETLLQGTANRSFGPYPLLAFAFGTAFALGKARRKRTRSLMMAGGLAGLLGLPLVLEIFSLGSLASAAGFGLLLSAAAGQFGMDVAARMRLRLMVDEDSQLPNLRAMIAGNGRAQSVIIAVRLRNFDQMAGVLSASVRSDLVKRIVSRLELVAGIGSVHALQSGVFGWTVPLAPSDELNDIAEAIAAMFRSPIPADGRSVLVSPSIGMAANQSSELRTSIGQAIAASREAEGQELRWLLHNDQITSAAEREITLLADIDHAMDSGEIRILYQPKIRLADERIVSAEALVRWHHPVLGVIMPDHFIPLLEKSKRMADLTLHVLDQTARRLEQASGRATQIGLAVNVSAPLFDDADFVERMAQRVASLGMIASRLTLEITESASIAEVSRAVESLARLRALGARISIDDYGTGQSTLKYLKTYPIDEIKIDKSFVTNLLDSQGDRILVRSTIEMAHDLGYAVVAEGIETRDCLDMLVEFGCDYGQGWFIEKAIEYDALVTMAESREATPPQAGRRAYQPNPAMTA